MAAQAPPPLHQSFRGALDATTELDADRLGTTVFREGFAETARSHFRTLLEEGTSTISFDGAAGAIGDIRTVEDAFVLFGLKPDDRTSRREQIKMWTHVEKAMTSEIKALTSSGRVEAYDRAKALNAALLNVKAGFAGLQTREIRHAQTEQRTMFEHAKKGLAQSLVSNEKDRKREERRELRAMRASLAKRQGIEHENLEHAILVSVPPLQRHSCRVMELRRAETNLSSLHQYDDAKNVRRMLDKIEGPAKRVHEALLANRLHVARQKLTKKHVKETASKTEKIGEIKFSSQRRAHRHASIQRQKCTNLDVDMRQANAFDQCKSPELVVHPSAGHQRRRGFDATAAQLNGRKLLDSIRGKKVDEAVYVAPVCETHNFETPLLDTHLYDTSSSHYMSQE